MKNVILILLLAASGFGISSYALPAWENVRQYRDEINKINNAQKQAEEIKNLVNEALERRRKIPDADWDNLKKMLPKTIQKEELYVFFQRIAQDSGMQFGNVIIVDDAPASNTDTTGGGKRSLMFDMQATGSYDSMRTMIERIENNLKLMDITSLDIKQESATVYLLSVKGKLYYGY